jgi:hypothetical protein
MLTLSFKTNNQNMKKIFILNFIVFCSSFAFSQDTTVVYEEIPDSEVEEVTPIETFYSTRIINGHSVETLKKGTLEFRIEHKFGDLAGTNGGINTLYGLDNVADIRIAFEYGITDKLMVGLGRSRGTSLPYHSLLDGFVKYRLLHQEKGKMPVSVALVGSMFYSYMPASSLVSDVAHFPKQAHRFAYSSQINIARKFGKRWSLALMPTYVHRNYVAADDVNGLFSLGTAVNFAINSKVSLAIEYYNNFQKEDTREKYHNSLSIAVDWVTFGHNFKVFLTNSGGFGEVQFIPYTNTDWAKGQFRLGFCIARKYMKE